MIGSTMNADLAPKGYRHDRDQHRQADIPRSGRSGRPGAIAAQQPTVAFSVASGLD
jgi:hypothetical protein